MDEQPQIGFYIPALDVGGAQRVTVNVANGLAERGYPVDLLLSYHKGELLDQVSDRVNVLDLETPRIPITGIGASVPGIKTYLEEREPAILFSAMTYASVVSIATNVISSTRTRVVGIEHSTFGNRAGLKERLTLCLARDLYRFANHIVAVSEGVADSVVANTAVSGSDVSVLYNPVPVATVRNESEVAVDDSWIRADELETIVWAGRLEPEKDLPTLLRAFASVNRGRPNTRLILMGTGSERGKLLQLSETLGIEQTVALPGYVENPYPYMRRASVFVLSSEREGLPTVLIEALACGCPVVSTDCPSGPREILADGTYGKLVPVGDESALAEAIRLTLDDLPDRTTLSERADDFSTEVVVKEYVTLIEEVLV
jgi:glycosyltransferase involved in cell wall biosynthesis